MKSILFQSSCIIILFIQSLFSSASLAESSETIKKVIIGIDEWPPYHSKDLKHFGFCTHIMTEAFQAVGTQTEVQLIPWKRALNYSSNDGTLFATIWGGYTDWIYTHYGSDPVCKGEYVLFINKGMVVDFDKPESFREKKMGNIIGEGIPDQLQNIVSEGLLEVQSTSTVKSLFKMLANNRVDMIAINRSTGLATMREYLTQAEQEEITIHPERFRISFYRLILSKESKEESIKLLEKFNIGLNILHSTGQYERMLDAELRGDYNENK